MDPSIIVNRCAFFTVSLRITLGDSAIRLAKRQPLVAYQAVGLFGCVYAGIEADILRNETHAFE